VIVQRALERPGVPWRNGLGVQYEITADGPLPDGWGWRLSTADITTNVAFSSFPGVDRFFCVGTGNGVILTIDGVDHRCEPRSVTHFRGDAEISATLIDGPMRAVNLMVRDVAQHRGYHVAIGGATLVAACVVALEGGAVVRRDGVSHRLDDLDAVICPGLVTIDVVSGVVVAVS
jgi:environmental stress-induced protein Ves